ncbi:MAG: hypothetical protein VB876_10130, partial [Pirellulales bacterium]
TLFRSSYQLSYGPGPLRYKDSSHMGRTVCRRRKHGPRSTSWYQFQNRPPGPAVRYPQDNPAIKKRQVDAAVDVSLGSF